jgi:hypothetical protein
MSKQHTTNQQIDQQINSLARDKSPDRDLWQGIEFAIVNQSAQQSIAKEPIGAKPKPHKVRQYLAIAASICILGFIGVIAIYQYPSMRAQSLVATLSAEHQKQKQALLISFKDATAATNNWQQQLDDLDEAETAIKQALKEAPNNQALLKMLKQVYEQQLAIIEKVHAPAWQHI